VTKLLLSRGAKVPGGATLLHQAAVSGAPLDVIQSLIVDGGADPNIRDMNGCRASDLCRVNSPAIADCIESFCAAAKSANFIA
jgi:hypothetical protein